METWILTYPNNNKPITWKKQTDSSNIFDSNKIYHQRFKMVHLFNTVYGFHSFDKQHTTSGDHCKLYMFNSMTKIWKAVETNIGDVETYRQMYQTIDPVVLHQRRFQFQLMHQNFLLVSSPSY